MNISQLNNKTLKPIIKTKTNNNIKISNFSETYRLLKHLTCMALKISF